MQYLLDKHEYSRLTYKREKLDKLLDMVRDLSHQIFAKENFGGTFSEERVKEAMKKVNKEISSEFRR